MSFLAPLFLLGALAVAAPVVFHLIRRTTREQAPFSTLMFLKPSPPRLTRKSRIEHWLLLLLRSAVVVLLALAFARPFFRQAAAEATSPDAAKHRVILVDTSASMRRDGLWDAARSRLAAELRAALPGDRMAVFTFDRAVTPVMTFDDWQSLPPGDRTAQVLGRLGNVAPSWAGTQLGQALLRAAEELAGLDVADAAREIVLISDVQEGGRIEALQAFDWPRGVALRLESLRAPAGGNAGLQIVAEAADTARTAAPAVRVRVVNSPDARSEQLQIAWAALDGRPAGPPVDVYVPPGQARIVTLPVPTNGPAPDRVVLRGDAAPFDNAAFVVPPQPAETVVAYLGAEAAEDAREPLFFLRRALTPTARQRLGVVQPGPTDPLPAAALWVVTGNLSSATVAELRARLQDGATVLFAPRDASAAPALAALLGLPAVPLAEAPAERFALLGELDFRHPLLAPFADPRFSDFTKIRFWRHRRLDAAAIPEARVVARFDDGDPAWLDVPTGRGRLVVFTSGWHPADSQLALSSKFVPLLFALLDLSGAGLPAAASLAVGEAWPLPAPAAEGAAVTTPDGGTAALAVGAREFAATTAPGIYVFRGGGSVQRFTVNLDPLESRTAPLMMDAFEQAGAQFATAKPVASAPRQPALRLDAEQENRQRLWRGFVLAALAVALAAIALAGWTARQTPQETPA